MTIASRYFRRTLKLSPATTSNLRVERDLRVPMPDGVVLLADRYAPGRRRPLVLVRSPYGRRGIWGLILGPAARRARIPGADPELPGDVRVWRCLRPVRDRRARRRPGHDRVDAAAALVPGLVRAPSGPSYLGMVQWAIAADAGPDLAAMATQVDRVRLQEPFYAGESFSLETALTWVHRVATQETPAAFLRRRWPGAGSRRSSSTAAVAPTWTRLAAALRVTFFQEWLPADAPGDPVEGRGLQRPALDRVTAPVGPRSAAGTTSSCPGSCEDYAALGPGRARAAPDHRAVVPTPTTAIGGRERAKPWPGSAPTCSGDPSSLRPAPSGSSSPARASGATCPSWPPPGMRPQRWHLQPAGASLPDSPPASEPDRYRYDPADPTRTWAGLSATPAGPAWTTGSWRPGPTSSPTPARRWPRTLEVMGESASTCSCAPAWSTPTSSPGCATWTRRAVGQHLRRAAPRSIAGRPAPSPTARSGCGSTLWPTAHRFRRGHRLRLQVSSGAHPRVARNPGSGEPLGTATTMVAADQAVYHDPEHPSAIVLPVAKIAESSLQGRGEGTIWP